jgi:TM2 domain-containing membrane protein YozV
MSKKVWVLDDIPGKQVSLSKKGQKVWVLEDSFEEEISAKRDNHSSISALLQNREQKNPSLAYSLSILIWGCGQFYNRQWRSGVLFLLFMIMFTVFMGVVVVYWQFITSSFESVYISHSEAFLILGFFYLLGLIVWHFNAWQAYFRSIKMNQKSTKNIKGTVLPAVCSLLMPGWGQLLNGQTKKGLFFQLFSFTGLAVFPFIIITFLLWPTLETSRSRFIIEWIFSMGILLFPFFLLIWLLNIFDAAKVSLDYRKKEPFRMRMKYVINRFRYHMQVYGWKNALLAFVKRNALVIVLLVFCVISFHYVPRKFYGQQLQNLGDRMTERDMTVIPDIIRKLPRGSSI